MQVLKCDRCGRISEENVALWLCVILRIKGTAPLYRQQDLCPDCRKKQGEFLGLDLFDEGQ